MSKIIVSKYGGSSITCFNDLERIKKITLDDKRRKVIIVSAPGRRKNDDTKVTDLLIKLAKTKDKNIVNKIIKRYEEISNNEKISILKKILEEKLNSNLNFNAYLDSLKAFGEEACAMLLAWHLEAEYVDPKDLFLVSEDFGNARILPESEKMIKKRLSKNKIYVIPGFYGYTKNKDIATFSRGGSDLTGAYIAASLHTLFYENFTDQDGVLSADPNLIKNPEKIKELTFKEMRDLSYSGFKILHQESLAHVEKKNISVHIRNTFNYPSKGTFIVNDRVIDKNKPIIGVAYQDGFCSFNIEKFGLNEELGIARKILQIFEDNKISIEFIPTLIDDFSVILKYNQIKNIDKIINELYLVLGTNAHVNLEKNLSCLVVAGKGLKGRIGITTEIQKAISDKGINIRFISFGAQERCIIYGVNSNDGIKAVNAVYEKYLKNSKSF